MGSKTHNQRNFVTYMAKSRIRMPLIRAWPKSRIRLALIPNAENQPGSYTKYPKYLECKEIHLGYWWPNIVN
jgi:hypothetical protein